MGPSPTEKSYRIAADIGGTFTDIAFVADDGAVVSRKVPSTPNDYAAAVIDGIRTVAADAGMAPRVFAEVLHGCTVATNAILEHRGARTALVTTRGFRDVLELRRIRMPRLYDPLWVKPPPLVPRELRFEITERMDAKGVIVAPLDLDELRETAARLADAQVEAVAVVFLHSYANPQHEQKAGEVLRQALPGCFVSLSVELLPEIREYERTSTTVINAYVGPPVKRYVSELAEALAGADMGGRLLVMQSSGGILDAAAVLERPAQIVEGGPAAGVIGAVHIGRRCGYPNLITLDMGGTTAKASIIEDGAVVRTDEYEVGGGISLSSRLVKGGGYALKTPVIDISEVGAGGGSLVWFDKAGALKVGPQSAGAVPGPACYETGGAEPTVTDANLVLGYLNPTAIAGGSVPVSVSSATAAIADKVATPLGMEILDAAWGIHSIANANIMRALKAVSTYRGRDPRDFVMLAFGGSGGMHAVELARSLHMNRVVVPAAAGVFSALGLLFSDVELVVSRAFLRRTDEIDPGEMEGAFRALEKEVVERLGYLEAEVSFQRFAELRYAGQAFELTVKAGFGPVTAKSVGDLEAAFEAEHERTYGHRFPGERAMQTVNLRIGGTVESRSPRAIDVAATLAREPGAGHEHRRDAYFGPRLGIVETAVVTRAHLGPAARPGPLVIEDREGTAVVPPGASAALDEHGSIVIEVNASANMAGAA